MTQPEQKLENDLVAQLVGMGYARAAIHNEEALLANLQEQLQRFNKTEFSGREFKAILNHLAKGNVFAKAKTLRDRFQLHRDDGDIFYVRFFDSEQWLNNLFQVTHQITVEGTYKNRYDVTLLINGLPLAHIELKRRGLELKEAFNQINRYQRHSFFANDGLFQYAQIFIISNGVNTKYYANNPRQPFKQTFCWADEQNRNISDLSQFADAFLNRHHLGKMIAQYVVFNETFKILMVLRPYQVYAVEAMIARVVEKGRALGEKRGEKRLEGGGPALTMGIASVAPRPGNDLEAPENISSAARPRNDLEAPRPRNDLDAPENASTEVRPRNDLEAPELASVAPRPRNDLEAGSASVTLRLRNDLETTENSSAEVQPRNDLETPENASTEVRPRNDLEAGSASVAPRLRNDLETTENSSAEVQPRNDLDAPENVSGAARPRNDLDAPENASVAPRSRNDLESGSASVAARPWNDLDTPENASVAPLPGNDLEYNGYIWHSTGSGKTLTSFKASQIIMDLPGVHKVVFVVDRKDLDYQTMNEFNSFKKECVDVTDNTRSLVRQLTDDTRLIVTTIQKLNNAVSKSYYSGMAALKDKRMVFIFDECHRSQFGETHKRITEFFSNIQLFGFTGTPIFADNASRNEYGLRTTRELFGPCLHKYVITDAIRDQNVLRFSIEYIGRYREKSNTFIDIEVEDIDRKEVLESPDRMNKIVDYIIRYHNAKTHNRDYTAIFAVSSISNLIKYYELFKLKKLLGEHDLRVAAIFTYAANEDDLDATDVIPDQVDHIGERPTAWSSTSRDKLDEFIADYNAMYGARFSTRDSRQFESYFKDISKRIKEREKTTFNDRDRLDILLVVNMFLTGFDAKKVNTLYVDKSLHHHGVIQAYSRTNRTLGEQKSHGNILCFRNLKRATDDAVALYANKEAIDQISMPPHADMVEQFSLAFADLVKIAPTIQSVDALPTEDQEMAFIQAFRALMRLRNVLITYADFSWDNLPMTEQAFEDYKSKYLDLYDKVRGDRQPDKVSILDDVDFELELIHRDEVNVAYILKLLARLKQADPRDKKRQKDAILTILSGDVKLRSKRELIEKFILENLPHIDDVDAIADEFDKYWNDQKILALGQLCDEEKLDQKQFQALIDAYLYSSREPLRDEVFDCLDDRPSVLQAQAIGERIIARMKRYVDVFIRGIAAA